MNSQRSENLPSISAASQETLLTDATLPTNKNSEIVCELLNKKRGGRAVYWSRQTDEVILEILELAAEELKIPLSLISSNDLVHTKFEFLGDRTLERFYKALLKRSPPNRSSKKSLGLFLESFDIFLSISDLEQWLLSQKRINWDRVPQKTMKQLLELIAEKKGTVPFMLKMNDFIEHFDFLNGKALSELRMRFWRLRGDKSATEALFDFAGIKPNAEEIINLVRSGYGEKLRWKMLSKETIRNILELYAKELKIPASMLTPEDLLTPHPFFANNSLYSLYHQLSKTTPEDLLNKCTEFLREYGLIATAKDIVELSKHKDRKLPWKRLTVEQLREILLLANNELSIPELYFNTYFFRKVKFKFLNGRTLKGLYEHLLGQIKPERQESKIQAIERTYGIRQRLPALVDDFISLTNPHKKLIFAAYNIAYFCSSQRFKEIFGNEMIREKYNYTSFESREKMIEQCRLMKYFTNTIRAEKRSKLSSDAVLQIQNFVSEYRSIYQDALKVLNLSPKFPHLPL